MALKSPLMRVTYGFQNLDSLLQVIDCILEHATSAFQSLDLIFEVFD